MIRGLVSAVALLVAFLTPGGAAWAAPKGAPWGEDYFPNVPVVNQDGKTLKFYDDLMKDKKVLINFIFTSCVQACPLDTAKMAQVQKLLGDRVGRDVFMYSITLDPENDTPEKLKAYAEKFGVGPGWQFLTGKREDIDKIRYKLGSRQDKEEHANAVQAGDVAKGRWMRLPLTADANYIMVEVNDTFFPEWSIGKDLKSIAEAPRPEIYSPGQLLFNNRCAACHTFGEGDRLGPDLKGVTARRDRAWLVRFIAAPDKMRANNDPISVELAKRYKVLMPNLGLTNQELDDVTAYLAAKSGPPLNPATSKVGVAPAAADRSEPAADAGHDHGHHQANAAK